MTVGRFPALLCDCGTPKHRAPQGRDSPGGTHPAAEGQECFILLISGSSFCSHEPKWLWDANPLSQLDYFIPGINVSLRCWTRLRVQAVPLGARESRAATPHPQADPGLPPWSSHWDQQDVLLSPQQEPSPKLTLIFVASFPGSSGGNDFSCGKSRGGGDQRGREMVSSAHQTPSQLPGWLPQGGRKREKGEERRDCPVSANSGTQGR